MPAFVFSPDAGGLVVSRSLFLGSLLLVSLTAASCQDELTNTAPVPFSNRFSAAGDDVQLDRGALQLPAGARINDQVLANLGGAINPSDYVCPASTPVADWWLDEVFDFIGAEPAIFNHVYNQRAADLVVMYEALYFGSAATPQYFGYNGEHTHTMVKAEQDLKNFWDINSAGIQVIGMHGNMLQDTLRTAATYRLVFGLSPATSASFARSLRNAVLQSTKLNGGDHALFSFNAFAISFGPNGPNKIVMGDAILAGYDHLGFGDVAPQGIFAHEFAHHIQFENEYFDDAEAGLTAPEQTRYTELMADAMAAYYLTHKRGATMNQKRVEQFLEVFYQIGDCGFTSGGHHGTPNQRMRAAQFGFRIANEAHKQGHIMGAEAFHDLFVAEYARIVAPDNT
jgi:hypothetical protein